MSPTQVDNMTTPFQQAHHPTMLSNPSYMENNTMNLDPLEIGSQFVYQYYTILNQDPKQLHGFYNKTSQFTYGMEAEAQMTVVGPADIHSRILDLDLANCQVAVLNLDCQPSINGSILVFVIGQLYHRDYPPQRFSQTFFLVEQSKGYYVQNDIFRFHKKNEEIQDFEEPTSTNKENKSASDESYYGKENRSFPVSSNQPKGSSSSLRTEELKSPEPRKHEEIVHVDSSKQPTKETLAAPLSNSKTWASLAAVGQEQWGPNVSKVTATSVLVQSYSTVGEPVSERKLPEKNIRPELDVSRCVFLKNLTPDMTEENIRSALSRFGQIVSIDIFSNKVNGYVEFTNSQSAKDAIAARTIKINNANVALEEKRAHSKPPRGPSKYDTRRRGYSGEHFPQKSHNNNNNDGNNYPAGRSGKPSRLPSKSTGKANN